MLDRSHNRATYSTGYVTVTCGGAEIEKVVSSLSGGRRKQHGSKPLNGPPRTDNPAEYAAGTPKREETFVSYIELIPASTPEYEEVFGERSPAAVISLPLQRGFRIPAMKCINL